MLHLLKEYAHRNGLVSEPGFASKEIRWAIVCDDMGRYLDIVELGDVDARRNRGRTFARCPQLSFTDMKAGGITKSHFLWETVEVVTFFGKAGDDPQKAAKRREKHLYFVNLLRSAAVAVPAFSGLADQLEDDQIRQGLHNRISKLRIRPTEKITFKVGDSFPVESDLWHDWWRERRQSIDPGNLKEVSQEGKKREHMRSFLSGQLLEPLKVHPKVKRLSNVGGLTTGDVVIGFKQESFRSYGLKQSFNAAVSEPEAYEYAEALNHLISNHGRRLSGAKVVHWFKNRANEEDDPLSWLAEGFDTEEMNAQEKARELLDSIRTGTRPDLHQNYYYALTMSGASGRVMVRDWMEGQFEELVASISNWFDDLAMTNISGRKMATNPSIERVITALLPLKKEREDYKNWLKPAGAFRGTLWKSAIRGTQISPAIIGRLAALNKGFLPSDELRTALHGTDTNNRGIVLSLLYARMALIKAYHVRTDQQNGKESHMKPFLNEEHPSAAYHCGRLMAVLAGLQRAALGDVGAGVVQRYYAAASTTPALVLGTVTRLSQHHLNRIDSTRLTHWYESKLANIWGRIENRVPNTLTLEEQSLFALGYYQQMADMRTKKHSNDNNQKETDDE